ncbi:MAG: PEGA domain-containing protein [Acidobacteria bacterium]|nr:PEGA domain-containing protein [Acidobacteriota bacterium]
MDTVEGTADVYRDGKKIGETPYTIEASIGDTVNLVLKRDGFEDYADSFQVTAQTGTKTYPMLRK